MIKQNNPLTLLALIAARRGDHARFSATSPQPRGRLDHLVHRLQSSEQLWGHDARVDGEQQRGLWRDRSSRAVPSGLWARASLLVIVRPFIVLADQLRVQRIQLRIARTDGSDVTGMRASSALITSVLAACDESATGQRSGVR